jgi:hypothetical protein
MPGKGAQVAHRTGGWVDPRAGLHDAETRSPAPRSSVVQPLTSARKKLLICLNARLSRWVASKWFLLGGAQLAWSYAKSPSHACVVEIPTESADINLARDQRLVWDRWGIHNGLGGAQLTHIVAFRRLFKPFVPGLHTSRATWPTDVVATSLRIVSCRFTASARTRPPALLSCSMVFLRELHLPDCETQN